MSRQHLIMLPGMMCDERLFTPQIDEFSSQFEIVVPPLSQYRSMQEIAADILSNAPDQFSLLGLSMGGIVAMEIVTQAEDRVKALALLDTNPMAELPDVGAAREPQIENVRNGKLLEVMRDDMKPRYLYDGARKSEILDLCLEMALDLGAEAFINQSIALQNRSDYCGDLRNFHQPSLVLCGQFDTLCPPDRHHMIHDLLPNSQLSILAEAGHLPTLEKPKATNTAIRTFFDNIGIL